VPYLVMVSVRHDRGLQSGRRWTSWWFQPPQGPRTSASPIDLLRALPIILPANSSTWCRGCP